MKLMTTTHALTNDAIGRRTRQIAGGAGIVFPTLSSMNRTCRRRRQCCAIEELFFSPNSDVSAELHLPTNAVEALKSPPRNVESYELFLLAISVHS